MFWEAKCVELSRLLLFIIMDDQSNIIDTAKIKHIAHLARIGISDAAAEKYAVQVRAVMDYMKILEEVDVTGVEMTSQVTGLRSVTRKDEVIVDTKPEELMAVSTLPKISGQIAVRAVIEEE